MAVMKKMYNYKIEYNNTFTGCLTVYIFFYTQKKKIQFRKKIKNIIITISHFIFKIINITPLAFIKYNDS